MPPCRFDCPPFGILPISLVGRTSFLCIGQPPSIPGKLHQRCFQSFRNDADPQLAAYVVTESGNLTKNDSAALRWHCKGALPPAAVPPSFQAVRELPVLASGKIDRSSLPNPTVVSEGESLTWQCLSFLKGQSFFRGSSPQEILR